MLWAKVTSLHRLLISSRGLVAADLTNQNMLCFKGATHWIINGFTNYPIQIMGCLQVLLSPCDPSVLVFLKGCNIWSITLGMNRRVAQGRTVRSSVGCNQVKRELKCHCEGKDDGRCEMISKVRYLKTIMFLCHFGFFYPYVQYSVQQTEAPPPKKMSWCCFFLVDCVIDSLLRDELSVLRRGSKCCWWNVA